MPSNVALGPDGSVYVADGTGRIRRVAPSGMISTVAGTGVRGFNGDGGPATNAQLTEARGIAVAPDGALYFSDSEAQRIRKVAPDGTITTIAGSGPVAPHLGAYSGDGGPATAARLNKPHGLALAPDGTLYFVDVGNNCVRKVSPGGVISSAVGRCSNDHALAGFSGDGGPAASAQLRLLASWDDNALFGLALGPDGSLYVSDRHNHRVRKVSPNGVITTVAGDGRTDASGHGHFGGDGGPATAASLGVPSGLAVTPDGAVTIADSHNNRIRRVTPDGVIRTVAGGGIEFDPVLGYSGEGGDNGPATSARLIKPGGIAARADGSIWIAGAGDWRVRKVSPDGIISNFAGISRFSAGDGGPATAALLYSPRDVAAAPDGTLYITDPLLHRVRRVSPGGQIAAFAGSGYIGPFGAGDSHGDGGPAGAARLNEPGGLDLGRDGSLYIADSRNHRIRKVDPSGVISTIAGTGDRAYGGDGGAATAAHLKEPSDIAVAPDGAVYVADTGNNRIRKISGGIITTFAGNGGGSGSPTGDGGLATSAAIDAPVGVALGPDGSLYIAEARRVRKVAPNGVITTVAGSGDTGPLNTRTPEPSAGDGGPATGVVLSASGVAVDAAGTLYISESNRARIRRVSPDGTITTIAGRAGSEGGYGGEGVPAANALLCGPRIGALLGGDLLFAESCTQRVRRISSVGVGVTAAPPTVTPLPVTVTPATPAASPSLTPTARPTLTTPTSTPSATATASLTATANGIGSATSSATSSVTPSATSTSTASPTVTAPAAPTSTRSAAVVATEPSGRIVMMTATCDAATITGSIVASAPITADLTLVASVQRGGTSSWADTTRGSAGFSEQTAQSYALPLPAGAGSEADRYRVAIWSGAPFGSSVLHSNEIACAVPPKPSATPPAPVAVAPRALPTLGPASTPASAPATSLSAASTGQTADRSGVTSAQGGDVFVPNVSGQIEITSPDRLGAVALPTGATPHVPDAWCPAERIYRAHIRLVDEGIAGATFGVAEGGFLDWIPPEHAGCVDWSKVGPSVTFPKEVIMRFRLLRPVPGALLWVLDGDAHWNRRLYEVLPDGKAHYVSAGRWNAQQAHYAATWANVIPVSWRQIGDLGERGLVGPDL